jgi:hypothetical protein
MPFIDKYLAYYSSPPLKSCGQNINNDKLRSSEILSWIFVKLQIPNFGHVRQNLRTRVFGIVLLFLLTSFFWSADIRTVSSHLFALRKYRSYLLTRIKVLCHRSAI